MRRRRANVLLSAGDEIEDHTPKFLAGIVLFLRISGF